MPGLLEAAGLRDRDLGREGLLLLEGFLLLERALGAGLDVLEVACVPDSEERVRAALGGRDIDLQVMGRREMGVLAGFAFHRGVLALARRPEIPRIGDDGGMPDLLRMTRGFSPWGVTDPSNLGGLVRTAAALGAGYAILGGGQADPFSRKALRASMGAVLDLPLLNAGSIDGPALALLLGSAGIQSLAALASGGETVSADSPRLEGPWCLFLGNEGLGLPSEMAAACARGLSLPMAPGRDSLNVAAAGAILLWRLLCR